MRLEFTSRSAIVLVVLAAVAVYFNSVWNGFAYDDVPIILQNGRVHELSGLKSIWLTPYWPYSGRMLGLYRPLAIFAYAVQWAIAGGGAWIFHATCVLLHAGVCVLVFLLLARFTGNQAATVGALVFAVHPVHTEAVANIVGQAEMLAAAGVLGACVVYVSRPAGFSISWRRLSVVAALFLIALLAKEGAIVLPGLLVLLDVVDGRVAIRKEDLRQYFLHLGVPFLMIAATAFAYLTLRVDVLGSITGSDAGPSLPYLREEHRLLSAFRAWPEYIRLMFFPLDLSADYSPAVVLPVESWTPMAVLGLALLVGVVGLAAVSLWRPATGFPAAWFLIAISPVANLFFPIGVLVAERTLYLPSVAVAAVASLVWHRRVRSRGAVRPVHAFPLVAIIILLMGIRTVVRNPDWKDTPTVMAALLRDHPESYRAQWSEGIRLLMEEGDTLAAIEHLEFAYRLWPRDSHLLTTYGSLHVDLERAGRAVELLETADALHPNLPAVTQNLARAYIEAERFEDAIHVLERGFRQLGPNGYMFDMLARAYAGLGNDSMAAAAWRSATRRPIGDTWVSWGMLAGTLHRMGDRSGALAALDTALVRAAGDTTALRRLDEYWTYVTATEPAAGESARQLQIARPTDDDVVR